jgi:DNA invertase Pin-like site-specific DNA recombinase
VTAFIGYARVTKDLKRDALAKVGVDLEHHVYTDAASGKRDRPGLDTCIKELRHGDTLVAWKLANGAAVARSR